ncbi:MAG: hypothetical protein ABIP78_11820 [Pyrinomonadaceae bacterium]
MPTRWQFARGCLWSDSGFDSEHIIAVRSSEAISTIRLTPHARGFRLWLIFAARLRQVFIPDAVLTQQLSQHQTVVLRPSRTGKRSHVADKLNIVLLEQLEKVRERMPAVSDGVDHWCLAIVYRIFPRPPPPCFREDTDVVLAVRIFFKPLKKQYNA